MKLKQRIANTFGYDLTRRTKNHDSFKEHFYNLLEKYKINCIVDVGANCGQYAQKLREFNFNGRICSFEPVKKNFDELQSVSENDAQWNVFHCALGSEDGDLEINVFKSTVLTSFLSPTEALNDMFKTDENSKIDYKEKVEVKTLFNMWNEIISGIDQPKVMLKMDTQGYDLEVFAGAEAILNQVSVIQSELSAVPLYEGMPDYVTALSSFRSAGFEISGTFPISRNLNDLKIVEFDCVLVNPKLVQKN